MKEGTIRMTVTKLTKEHYKEAMKLSEYAFQYKVPEERVEERLELMDKHHQLYGVFSGEELAAKLHLLPLEVYIGGQTVKMGGVAGVATYPEYRRSGFVREMLTDLLETMKNEGCTISMLHPFSVPFYRKYGWELFSSHLKASLKSESLVMKKQAPGTVKRHVGKDGHSEEIENVYDQFASRFSGMLKRETRWWQQSIYSEDTYAAVYYNESGTAEGYLLYEVKDSKMTVEEFVPLTPSARTGLWNFICQHDSMIKDLEITTFESDPLFYSLKEPRIKAEVTPYFMARIVDAAAFLKDYEFSSQERAVLTIKDDYAPWNNGTYEISDGNVTKTDAEKGEISLSINALTAALFGYKRPLDLYEIGEMEGSEEAVDRLERLIPERKAFFYDFF